MTLDGTSRQNAWTKVREPLLSALVGLNLLAIAVVLFPPGLIRSSLLPGFLPYLYATGLFQSTGVFVPNPKKYNVTLWARILFADGTLKEWHMVDFTKLSPFDRFLQGRFRRWDDNICNSNPDSPWLHDAARYIARQGDSPNNHPVAIELIRHRCNIPAPGSDSIAEPFDDLLYSCKITSGDLQ